MKLRTIGCVELNSISAGLYQRNCICKSFVFAALIRTKWHITNDERVLRRTRNCANGRKNIIHLNRNGCFVAKDIHAKRISNENHWHACFVGKTGKARIIRRAAPKLFIALRCANGRDIPLFHHSLLENGKLLIL